METYSNINKFFEQKLTTLNCNDITKSYIISILTKYKTALNDLSNQSLTLIYTSAKYNQNFEQFQNLADWIFYVKSLFPEYLSDVSEDYYISLGQLSYYSCYKLLKKQWLVYEQMSDNFVQLSDNVRVIIRG